MSEKPADNRLRSEDLVVVSRVPDEATATLLCDFLGSQGIEALAVPVQVPWFPGVETLHHGYWGTVEVLSHHAARAEALLRDFARAQPQPDAPDAGDAPEGPEGSSGPEEGKA